MLWIEPCFMFYAGAFGGLCGAVGMALVGRRTQREYMSRMEYYWNEDIKGLRLKIAELSTKTVDKPVSKQRKHNNNNGYNHKRHFNQGA